MRPRVSIVYRVAPRYRIPFYERLRSLLALDGIDLDVYIGHADPTEATRKDSVFLPWFQPMMRRHLRILPGRPELEWQGAVRRTCSSQLVILEHAIRLISNYAHLEVPRRMRATHGPLIALWGHGRHFQKQEGRVARALRRHQLRRADWYFAYNQLSVAAVRDAGFPPDRITDVRNSIDTVGLREQLAAVQPRELEQFRREHDLRQGNVGLFCGGLYEEKRLGFLLTAAAHIRSLRPEFRLLILGAGPQLAVIERAAASHPWIRYLGAGAGERKALAFRAADIVLMPGLVGLVAIDSLVAGTPLLTTADGQHSPEIAYLTPGQDSLMLPKNTSTVDFANTAASLLDDDRSRAQLMASALEASKSLSIEIMSRRFADGIHRALAQMKIWR